MLACIRLSSRRHRNYEAENTTFIAVFQFSVKIPEDCAQFEHKKNSDFYLRSHCLFP